MTFSCGGIIVSMKAVEREGGVGLVVVNGKVRESNNKVISCGEGG
jgi:hypothetical protein